MTFREIVNANAHLLPQELGDSWGYDGVMNRYINDKGEDIDVRDTGMGLIRHTARRWGNRARVGHSHPERDYGVFALGDEVMSAKAGNFNNHNDFFLEEAILSYMRSDSMMSLILRMYTEGWSAKEIGEEIGKTTSYVSSYINRSRNIIRKELGINRGTKRSVRASISRPDVSIRNKKNG